MRHVTIFIAVSLLYMGVATRTAAAQRACAYAVPPSGGAYEIPVSPAYLTGVHFPAKLAAAVTSDLKDYEIRRDGDDGLLIRPTAATSAPANINIQSGAIRVSLALRTVTDAKDACALVTFTATTEEEARQRAVDEAVAKKTAALEVELTKVKAEQAARVREQLDAALADRAMARLEIQKLSAVDRNDDGVVVWVMRAVFLGNDLLVNMEIENRSGAAYRVADLELVESGKNRATSARLASGASGGLVGLVLPGAKIRGVVVVRDGGKLAGKDLSLVTRTPDGNGSITVHRLGVR